MAVLDRLGLGTILVDATDRITFISRTAQDLLQREASDIIGHSLQTGLPWPKEFSALLHAQEELPMIAVALRLWFWTEGRPLCRWTLKCETIPEIH